MLHRLPHPDRGFTQGLVVDGDGMVWESVGLYGESGLRRYRLGEKEPDAAAALPPDAFGEGLCRVGQHLWQLTWRERVAMRWDMGRLRMVDAVPYNREGWGICNAGDHLITSDGSSELVSRDPQTLEPHGMVPVRCGDSRVGDLNDLEWAAGRVWANILGRPYLAGIDPASGEVVDIVDARAANERHWGDPWALLNGIASVDGASEFLLTGKRWRFIYQVRLKECRAPRNPERLLCG